MKCKIINKNWNVLEISPELRETFQNNPFPIINISNHHLLNGMCIMQSSIRWKSWKAFNIRLNNHRKDVTNPKSIPADMHFRKPGHSFNLYAKFTLFKQLGNIDTTSKDTLKSNIKCCEDFYGFKTLETPSPKG